MRLEGSLDAFSLPDIFALLSMTKKTGGLHLRRDSAHGVVWFSSGCLTGGSPAIERQSLLRRVVSVAAVSPEALASARELAGEEGIGLVPALIRTGAVDEARVHEIAAEHVVDTVFSLLRWDNGDFEFVVDEPDRDPVGVERTVDDVVAEARRRLEEWRGLVENVPAPGTVLRLTPAVSGTVTLEPDQWSLLTLADGRRSVADVVELSGRGEYAALRSVADLIAAGVLAEAGAGDDATERRLAVLADIEGLPAPVAAPTSPAAVPEPQPAGDAGPAGPVATVGESLLAPAAEGAEPATLEPAGQTAQLGGEPRQLHPDRDLTRVTPQRPEPFRPGRRPEHPDGGGMPSTVGALAAATDPAPSSHIERDPSVNKSLLLRLIAGVRGL